jgi:hypothetical protein
MKRSRVWLVVTGLAFAAWIGYLFYLTRQVDRIILSRPQFLIAECVVIGRIDNKNGPVVVGEVFFRGACKKLHAGAKIEVDNLRQSLYNWTSQEAEAEWDLPGEFIIPLRSVELKDDKWSAEVVPLPPSPGLQIGTRIYPRTQRTLEQLESIPIGK